MNSIEARRRSNLADNEAALSLILSEVKNLQKPTRTKRRKTQTVEKVIPTDRITRSSSTRTTRSGTRDKAQIQKDFQESRLIVKWELPRLKPHRKEVPNISMLGGTHAGTKVLQRAEREPWNGEGLEAEHQSTTVSIPESQDSRSNSNMELSLKARVAEITDRRESGAIKAKRHPVVTDADVSDIEKVFQTLCLTRSESQDGGAQGRRSGHSISSTTSSLKGMDSKKTESKLDTGANSSGNSGKTPSSGGASADVLDPNLAEHTRTCGEKRPTEGIFGSPPSIKKAKTYQETDLDMRRDFKGLASVVTQNFPKLLLKKLKLAEESQKIEQVLVHEISDEDKDVEKVVVHEISDEEDDLTTPGPTCSPAIPAVRSPNPPLGASSSVIADRESTSHTMGSVKTSLFTKKRARDTADDLDENLATILTDKFWGPNILSAEKFLDAMNKSLRPGNVAALQAPALQECIWRILPEHVKDKDKWDRLTQMNLMVIWRELAWVIDTIVKHKDDAPWVPEVMENMLEIFGLAGYVNFNFNVHRRDTLRPGLPPEFKRSAGEGLPLSPEWLFGDNLSESVGSITKESKLTKRIFPTQKHLSPTLKSFFPTQKSKGQGQPEKVPFHSPAGQPPGGKKFQVKGMHSSLVYRSPLPQKGVSQMSSYKKPSVQYRKKRRGRQGRAPVVLDLPSADEITQKHLDEVAEKVADKVYDQVDGTTCHQCRQKTYDMKSICRAGDCPGIRGRFCGPCLLNRYGEDVKDALKDPNWRCPPCRGRCNCSICRRKQGRASTGILIHMAKELGYSNVDSYLYSISGRGNGS